MTVVTNLPSRRVMERLGLTRDEQADFDHPAVWAEPWARHVLYRIGAEQWRALPATC